LTHNSLINGALPIIIHLQAYLDIAFVFLSLDTILVSPLTKNSSYPG